MTIAHLGTTTTAAPLVSSEHGVSQFLPARPVAEAADPATIKETPAPSVKAQGAGAGRCGDAGNRGSSRRRTRFQGESHGGGGFGRTTTDASPPTAVISEAS
ncbi:hypothetical protein GCM10017673_39280 [Streptosporangium violaceochromogenes]|nr:hypothetical protein GCM10017673_39280 [Streptosporangium violaceochromogenes]